MFKSQKKKEEKRKYKKDLHFNYFQFTTKTDRVVNSNSTL